MRLIFAGSTAPLLYSDPSSDPSSGEIGGEQLLRRLNPDNEPLELAAEKLNQPEPLPLSESWRELVKQNMDFNPDAHFEDMQFLDLRGGKPNWRKISASERAVASKQSDASLREKYGKEKC